MKNKLTILFILVTIANFGQTTDIVISDIPNADQNDIISAMNELNNNGTITIKVDVDIESNLTIEKGIDLRFFNGNKLIIKPNVDLTINGTIKAGTYQIFELEGSSSTQGNVIGGGSITKAYPEWFGAVADGVTDDTQAILQTIHFLRKNGVSIASHIGGDPITVYSSGTVKFSSEKYLIKSSLLINQDLGLTFSGNGSRKSNQAVYGTTTLLFDFASDVNGYCIKAEGNGGRGLTLENMDICYSNKFFKGSIIDNFSSPGLYIKDCYIGLYNTKDAPTLDKYSAKSLLRTTYDEFITLTNCVFSGAKHGWWADTSRNFEEGNNRFGGSVSSIENCVFYDFTGSHILHYWTEPVDDDFERRTKLSVNIIGCAFNTIRIRPDDAIIKMRNVDGLNLIGNTFAPSTSNTSDMTWLNLRNVTGIIKGNLFGDKAKVGSISGMLDITGNIVFGNIEEDGFVLKGGVINASNNEISQAKTGFKIEPEFAISFNLGNNLFKSRVKNSYVIPQDNILLSGNINYSRENDQSTGKFINKSGRVKIENEDSKIITTSANVYDIYTLDTGRTFAATGSNDQVFNLPIPVAGTQLTIVKMSNNNLQIKTHPGTNFFLGEANALTIATADNTNIGGTIKLKAFGTAGWLVMKQGNWVFL